MLAVECDQEGYLIESRAGDAVDRTVVMVVGEDITSVGVPALDTERAAQFRVRAYRYGSPSNTAHRTTGGSPDDQ